MIEYNFYDLISKLRFISRNNFYECILPTPFPNQDSTIDTIWKQASSLIQKHATVDISEILESLKQEVLMSLYVSVAYVSLDTIDRSQIIKRLSESDDALKNKDSADSKNQSLSHQKKDLREDYYYGSNDVLTSGQLTSYNSLIYLRQYWENEKLRCFDITDYTNYIRANSFWPFSPKNLHGMNFFDYFKGIREMTQKWDFYTETNTIPSKSLEDMVSCYVLENLFAPVSFIKNVLQHLSITQDSFSFINKNGAPIQREQSMVLMQPLFRLPNLLWDKLATPYINSLQDYIHQNDIFAHANFKAILGVISYCSEYLTPQLKIMIGSALYETLDGNLNDIRMCLKRYLNSHINDFDYYTPLQESMILIAKTLYPKSKKGTKTLPLDLTGNDLLNGKTSLKGNTPKRNNESILTYEFNFTYNFFCQPDRLNYFDALALGFRDNIVLYINNLINLSIINSKNMPQSGMTPNYLQIKARDANIPSGTYISYSN